MMKCPNCNKNMTLEDYNTYFCNNEQEIISRDEYWCPECNIRIFKRLYYHLTNEEVEPV